MKIIRTHFIWALQFEYKKAGNISLPQSNTVEVGVGTLVQVGLKGTEKGNQHVGGH